MLETMIKSGQLNLQTHTPVMKIVPSSNLDSMRWTLHTPRGKIQAKHVILATNAWTSALLPGLADVLVPVRGTMSALLPPEGSQQLPNSYGFVGAGPNANPNADDYLIQRPLSDMPNSRGHLMFGGGRVSGTLPTVGETDDTVIDRGSVHYLQTMLPRLLELGGEPLAELKAAAAWSGIMCYSRDNMPWVGGVPGARGVWLCAGYTGHGMPNATLCAKALVKMLRGEEEGRDLEKVTSELVKRGDLPESYVITEDRLRDARELPSVRKQDDMGIAAFIGAGRGSGIKPSEKG